MNLPRRPTYFEMADYLTYFLSGDKDRDWEDISATNAVDTDLVAVFDNFSYSYPPYSGRIMVRVSGLQDNDVDLYIWNDGKIMSAREYKALKDITSK